MTEFSEKILAEIEKGHIKPIPRWHFLLKNYVVWGIFLLSVFLGSVSVSMVIDSLSRHWSIYSHFKGSFGGFILIGFPYVWALLLIGFLLLAYYDWKHTRHAYRHRTYLIVLTSIVLSIALGETGHALGFGRQFDKVMKHTMPAYKEAVEKKEQDIWSKPEMGTLAGEIKEVMPEGTVIVEDFKGTRWQVRCSMCDDKENLDSQKEIKKKKVKMIGKKKGENEFVAEEMRDWDDEEGREEEKDRSNSGKGSFVPAGSGDDVDADRDEESDGGKNSSKDGENDRKEGDRDGKDD